VHEAVVQDETGLLFGFKDLLDRVEVRVEVLGFAGKDSKLDDATD